MAALLTVETGDNVRSMVSRTATSVPDEAALVARAQGGNARAFEALYRANVDPVSFKWITVYAIAFGDHLGQDVFAEIVRRVAVHRIFLLQADHRLGVKDIDTH